MKAKGIGDLIAPPVFYFEGKPFEPNAAGIYIPIGSTFFKDPFGNLISTQQANALVQKHLKDQLDAFNYNAIQAQSMSLAKQIGWPEGAATSANYGVKPLKIADIIAAQKKMLWNPLSDSSVKPKHTMLDTGSLHGSLFGIPIKVDPSMPPMPPLQFGSLASFYGIPVHLIHGPSTGYAYQPPGSPYGPSPLQALMKQMLSRRRFIIEHDDSDLFMRGTINGAAEERDEQQILRGINGGGEYVWSDALQAHVRLA